MKMDKQKLRECQGTEGNRRGRDLKREEHCIENSDKAVIWCRGANWMQLPTLRDTVRRHMLKPSFCLT